MARVLSYQFTATYGEKTDGTLGWTYTESERLVVDDVDGGKIENRMAREFTPPAAVQTALQNRLEARRTARSAT